jgi:hypothetical protein
MVAGRQLCSKLRDIVRLLWATGASQAAVAVHGRWCQDGSTEIFGQSRVGWLEIVTGAPTKHAACLTNSMVQTRIGRYQLTAGDPVIGLALDGDAQA